MDSYLCEMGIKCHPPELVTTKLLQSFDLIVVGNVVARGSDEAQMIERLGVYFCSFPAALGAMILRRVKVVGICGTHAKLRPPILPFNSLSAWAKSQVILLEELFPIAPVQNGVRETTFYRG